MTGEEQAGEEAEGRPLLPGVTLQSGLEDLHSVLGVPIEVRLAAVEFAFGVYEGGPQFDAGR